MKSIYGCVHHWDALYRIRTVRRVRRRVGCHPHGAARRLPVGAAGAEKAVAGLALLPACRHAPGEKNPGRSHRVFDNPDSFLIIGIISAIPVVGVAVALVAARVRRDRPDS